MPERSAHDDEMGIGTKFTLGLVLWKGIKGIVKLGAMAGAVVLGWRIVSRALGRTTESDPQAVTTAV